MPTPKPVSQSEFKSFKNELKLKFAALLILNTTIAFMLALLL